MEFLLRVEDAILAVDDSVWMLTGAVLTLVAIGFLVMVFVDLYRAPLKDATAAGLAEFGRDLGLGTPVKPGPPSLAARHPGATAEIYSIEEIQRRYEGMAVTHPREAGLRMYREALKVHGK